MDQPYQNPSEPSRPDSSHTAPQEVPQPAPEPMQPDFLDEIPLSSEPFEEAGTSAGGFGGIVTVQAIFCVLAVIFFVLSQTFFPGVYEAARKQYCQMAASQGFPEFMTQWVGPVVSFFTAPPVKNTSSAPQSGATSQPAAGGSSGAFSQSSSPGGSSALSSSQASASSQENAVSAKESSGAANAAGGASIIKTSAFPKEGASSLPQGPLSPPQGATFAPVCFTVSPGLPLPDGALSSRFGYRLHPTTGALEFHKALDLAAPKGTPIYAVESGKVTAAAYSPTLGYYVAIQHSGGFVTRYGHCSELVAPLGAVVRKGEVIAKVGSTGDSTGNHLHLEMSLNGVVFDPAWVYDYD